MSVPPIDSPVGSFEVRCRVGQFVMDSDDPDRAPDLIAVGGTVTVEPDLRRPIRVHGENGPRVVGVDALEFTIDPLTGKLVHPDGEPGVELIDPTDEHLDPQGWTYTANVRPEKGRAWTVTFGAPTDDSGIVDLGSVVPVAPSPGVAENYLQQTITARDSAESFAVRAETAAQNAEDWAPSFAWDGTRLVIDGDTGPDLEGPAGPSVGGVGDVPGLQDVLDRVTYDSGWRALCRWSGGEVTEGELPTGLAPRGNNAGGVFVRRYPTMVSVAVVEADVTAVNPRVNLPSGFRGSTGIPYPAVPIYYRDANLGAALANAEFGSGFIRYRDVPAGASLSSSGTGGYGVIATAPSENNLPTTLPGTPA